MTGAIPRPNTTYWLSPTRLDSSSLRLPGRSTRYKSRREQTVIEPPENMTTPMIVTQVITTEDAVSTILELKAVDPVRFVKIAEQLSHEAKLVADTLSRGTIRNIAERGAFLDNRTDEEVARNRERILSAVQQPRSLPPGKTLEAIIVGALSDDKSDEEIRAAIMGLG